MQFRGPEIFKKKKEKGDTISRIIVPTWYLYAFVNKLAKRFWMDGLNLNVILMCLPIGFFYTTAIASTWQPVLEPINGVTGTWLSCFTTCDWLRALVHLHYNVMITTSTTKTRWSCRSLGVDFPCLRKKICHQNTMLMRWKVCKFKDEDLKIVERKILLEIVPLILIKLGSPKLHFYQKYVSILCLYSVCCVIIIICLW